MYSSVTPCVLMVSWADTRGCGLDVARFSFGTPPYFTPLCVLFLCFYTWFCTWFSMRRDTRRDTRSDGRRDTRRDREDVRRAVGPDPLPDFHTNVTEGPD